VSKSATYGDTIKLLLIGDIGVGKSALLHCFKSDFFRDYTGIDFTIENIELDKKRLKLQIWNTGAERFRMKITAYYGITMGILLVYDITDERSFNNIRYWFSAVKICASEGVNITLIGNKCDRVEKREISKEQGQALANEFKVKFLETSAKANISVKEAFFTLA
ncbi:small GTPase superfamily, partial [Gigaspora rosea]